MCTRSHVADCSFVAGGGAIHCAIPRAAYIVRPWVAKPHTPFPY